MNEARPGNGPTATPHLNPSSTLRPPTAGISLRPQPLTASGHGPTIAAPPILPHRAPIDDSPLELVSDERPAASSSTAVATEPPKSKIHGISAGPSLAAHAYKRPTHYNKTGAVRMKTFHCRLSEQGVDYLDQTINDWLESHPDIEVKFSTSTIGLWDGKLKEPTLIINVWY